MYKTKFQQKVILIALCACSAASIAQDAEVISLGSVDVIPTLNIQAAYDDNIRGDEDDVESDTIITIIPAIRALIDNGISGFSFDYSLTKGEYLSESDESFLNQTYSTSFGWNIIDTHVVTLSARLFDAHDARSPDAPSGSGRDELDKYEDTTYTFDYSYGDRTQFFGYSLTASLFDKRYKTNRETVVIDGETFLSTSLDDRETENYDARFNINPSETLQLSLLYGQSKTRYDEDDSVTQDSDQKSYGVGLNWEISEALDLSASFSNVERDLINDTDEDKSDQYSLSSTWAPYSYSRYTLSLSQTINEPNNTGADGEDFVEVQRAQIVWAHDWTDVFSTNLSYAKSESDYVGSNPDRLDESNTIAFGIGYQLRRWVGLNFDVSQVSRDGTEASPKSDRTIARLGAAFTL